MKTVLAIITEGMPAPEHVQECENALFEPTWQDTDGKTDSHLHVNALNI